MKKLVWLCMMMLVLSLRGPAAVAEEDYMTDSGEMRETDDGEVMEDSGEIDQMDDDGDYMDDSGEERNDSDY